MKLYNCLGPNPRVVRMFAAEKGIELVTEEVDLLGGANRQPGYLRHNPAGQLPALETDDGMVVAEISAVCEYLEELQPEPRLFGATALERAETRMWARRNDLAIAEPMANAFRFGEGLAIFANRVHVIPQAAEDLKATAAESLARLDGWIAGRTWICGERFSYADIALYGILDFGAGVGQPIDTSLANISAWFDRCAARPSATASLHTAAAATGMRG
jgi:glutathione S-transferase